MQRSQAAAVQNATPKALHATPAGETDLAATTSKAARPLKLRAHATPGHAAEVVEWRRQLADLVDEANRVIGPTLNARLEIERAEPWSPRSGDDDLSALGAELAARDPGSGVEWVIALAASLPRIEQSFHQLGLGHVHGKHFVMRAMNDAREYAAIERELSRVDELERRKLYRARKRHKAVTVFLHELGHTLGAMHEPDAATIMHASYSARVEGYSAATAGLMRLSLDHRIAPAATTERAFVEALLAHVKLNGASWVASERDATVARLEAALAKRAGGARARATRAAPPTPPPADDLLAALTAGDRAVFEQAVVEQREGRLREAWSRAKPLFVTYPDVYAVQDLRCQLAMQMGGAWGAVQAECARLMQLTPGATGRAKRD